MTWIVLPVRGDFRLSQRNGFFGKRPSQNSPVCFCTMRGMITSERPIAGNPSGYISLRSIPRARLQWTFWLCVRRFEVENNDNRRLGLLSANMSRNRRIVAFQFQVPKFAKKMEFSDQEWRTMVRARICAR